MGRRARWTDAEFLAAVRASSSIAGTCRALGLAPVGGNYQTVHAALRRLGADTSHWSWSAWNRGRKGAQPSQARPLSAILRVGTRYQSAKLHLRLLSAGLWPRECAACHGREWLGRPMPLELDHINGDGTDNRLENLRLLCPNCHALTDNWRGRNIRRRRRAAGDPPVG